MKVLLDLNVALDVVLNRQPWVTDSLSVWNAHQAGQIEGWLAATALTNMFYIVRRIGGAAKAQLAVRSCLATFAVVPVERSTLEEAQRQLGADFEDNVNIACAIAVGIDVIVTRDPAGYQQSPIPVASPAELISRHFKAKQGKLLGKKPVLDGVFGGELVFFRQKLDFRTRRKVELR